MEARLRIEGLAFGGSGVGRLDGKAVFVPFTAPGDEVRCRIIREKRRWAEAELVEVLSPSGSRRDPPCPVFGLCGGCQWQHLGYAEQLRCKEGIFTDTLQRQAGVPGDRVLPIVPAPDEWGYRSRTQFKCRRTEHGFAMGFYRRGSHFVVDVEQCPIAAPGVNRALGIFRQLLPRSPDPSKLPQVDIEIGDDGEGRAVVHHLCENPAPLADHLGPPLERAGISLFLQGGRKESLLRVHGEESLAVWPEGEEGPRLHYGAGGFAQVNLDQNRALVAELKKAAGLKGRERVLDLFCGMGNFSLPLAAEALEVVGVEDYGPAIAWARQNAARCGAANTRFLARPAEGSARELWGEGGFDLVVLDPPRAGAYEVCRELLGLRPRRLLYVSCDPTTLARDLVPLLHGGYDLRWTRPFDLFPQTHHTESLTLLERL